jgi:hypothetical protein
MGRYVICKVHFWLVNRYGRELTLPTSVGDTFYKRNVGILSFIPPTFGLLTARG